MSKVGELTAHGSSLQQPLTELDFMLFAHWDFGNWLEHRKANHAIQSSPSPISYRNCITQKSFWSFCRRRRPGRLCQLCECEETVSLRFLSTRRTTGLRVPVPPHRPTPALPKAGEGNTHNFPFTLGGRLVTCTKLKESKPTKLKYILWCFPFGLVIRMPLYTVDTGFHVE